MVGEVECKTKESRHILIWHPPWVKPWREVVLTATPFRIAMLVFSLVLGLGIALLFATDAFPTGVDTAREQGQFAGKTVGVLALLSGAVAWFVVRSRASRSRQ